jgi:hypothetical protein
MSTSSDYRLIRWKPGMFETPRSTGYVDEHREIAAQTLGRALRKGECVHHIDENPRNNTPENLMVFRSKADHARHHAGALPIPCGDGTFFCEGKHYSCKDCGVPLTFDADRCSKCAELVRRKHIPPKAELEELLWKLPTTHIASRYGVSDVAVGKWCKLYGLQKPPRGYWAKQPKDITPQ